MRAAVLREYGEPLSIETVPEPSAGPDGMVVAVEACGICRSDWHAWQGHGDWADDAVPRGQVLGHEPAGRVVETGARVTAFEPGDRVVVPFNLGDGTCRHCRSGHGNVCTGGWALGFEPDAPGAFAERVAVPAAEFNATRLPDDVSARAAAALGCRFMTAYHGLVNRADLRPGERVAVYGCGGVGLSAVQVAAAAGARPVGIDVDADALSMATDLGAEATVDAAAVDDVPAAARAATDGGADVTVDALGRAETCRNALASLARRGRHLQLGLTTDAERGEVAINVDRLTRRARTVLGSRGMPPSRYGDLLSFVASGAVDPGALVTRTADLADVPDRLAAMTDYGTRGVEVVSP